MKKGTFEIVYLTPTGVEHRAVTGWMHGNFGIYKGAGTSVTTEYVISDTVSGFRLLSFYRLAPAKAFVKRAAQAYDIVRHMPIVRPTTTEEIDACSFESRKAIPTVKMVLRALKQEFPQYKSSVDNILEEVKNK